ncbi:SusC/RagA family TonB-linked outer membrane protein [Parapedobacter pyrenivorans]|uniref:SusC/RagA family TonB-linked outer membrane protein n=1 Tax=Parapedobacter pyrenivorans TaxID=1305674 RepID=A0A917HXX9_9SPHI|nr:TonB-dependent receptor [Parapedobacter pyrenivorans]GGG96645.1 SusC/RagA family TonB-linked outer membrane protein [Parapedobacter pyrenivorans]
MMMDNLKWSLVLICLWLFQSGSLKAQSQPERMTIRGTVMNEQNEPLAGARVVERGVPTNGTATDESGEFVLTVSRNASLEISSIGYATQQLEAIQGQRLTVRLTEDLAVLDEVVVVGYGQQRVATVTGSVSQIKTDKITVAPQVNVTHTLAGQLPGLISKQTSGIPGADDAGLNIRGFGSPLVIVDGIETNINTLDPNQIETISILKDGAASIYGARAGNGVILVTTKRGKQGKPNVQVNSSFTLQGSTRVIRPASSAERAQFEVDKWLNSGKPADQVPFTQEEIQKFRDGSDPKYLNTNWFDAAIRRYAPQQNHNFSLSGGTEAVKYYGYFGANRQETILKTNGGNYDRYNVQANVEAKVTQQLSAAVDIQYFNEHRLYPSGADGVGSNNNFWRDLIYAADPSFALELPDPSMLPYAGITYGNPIFGTNSELSGAQDKVNSITQLRGELRYDVSAVPGLNAKGVVIYRANSFDQKIVKNQERFYTYSAETGDYTYVRSSQDPMFLSRAASTDNRLVQQYSLNYDRSFLDAHNVSGMFMYEYVYERGRGFDASRGGFQSMAIEELFAGDRTTSANNSSSFANGRVSWIGRLNYSYQDRYMVETILRADASSRFAQGQRWGYFPSVSLGWNIAKENFLSKYDVFDILKLRASYGSSGYDAVANFAYLAGYRFDATYTLGNTLYSGLIPTGLANTGLTWEQMAIYNAGLDFSLWRQKLYGEFEIFRRERKGIPGSRTQSLPTTFGAELPVENLNSQRAQGVELRLGTTGTMGDWKYDITGNIAYSRSKWLSIDEPVYTDPDEIRLYKRSGAYTDRRFGYVFDGLFTSQDEIDNWPLSFDALNTDNSSLRPGDVRYKDLNGDNVINWRDQAEIGKGAEPHWTFGLNLVFNYKRFDFSALVQGAFDYTTNVMLESAPTMLNYGNYWNERDNNRADALLPRPSGSSTNDFYSDYRNHNTAYARLKNLSLGYELPSAILTKAGISRFRIYVAGANLYTVSSLNKYGVDPEMPEGYGVGVYYPQQFTMSVGCNLSF